MAQRHLILLGALFAAQVTAFHNYSGFQVVTSSDVTPQQIPMLKRLELDPRFDFWSRPAVGRPVSVMSSPSNVNALYESLETLHLEPKLLMSDVGDVLEKERIEWENIKRTEKRSSREVTFDRYMEFQEILDYLDELAATYPELVSLEDIGISYEGRPLRTIKISNGPGKKQVFLDAGIHPREYLGPPYALKVIYELVENYAENKELVDALDWHILPITNPDGYVFTFTTERLWRKTRKPNEGSDCVGTDPNRNFDFHWGEDGDVDMCSQAYHGTNPFSEVESAALGRVLLERGQAGLISLYLATHTFGGFLLYPYGYTLAYPPNADDLQQAGDACADAIEAVNGTHYVVGSCANVYFQAFGSAFDYAYSVGNIPLSYTWELVGGGLTGFDPPNADIKPLTEELWQGTKQLAVYAASYKRRNF